MNIFLGALFGLIIGGVVAWFTASSKAKSYFERAIRDIENRAKGSEASRDAVQRQAVIFQEEIVTLKLQLEKYQTDRIQIEGEIKTSEAKKTSIQEKVDEYLKQISSLKETNENLLSANTEQKFQLNMANDRLDYARKNFENSQEDLSKLKEGLQKLQSENANLQISINVAESVRSNSKENINLLRYQEEITTLKLQLEKYQADRIQIEGEIKTSEAKKISIQEKVDEYLKQISSLKETNENLLSANTEQKSQLNMANNRLSYVQKNFENSQEDLSKLKEGLQKLQSENANLQISINVAESERDTLKENLSTFHSRFETLKGEKNEEAKALRDQHKQTIDGMADTFKALAIAALKEGNKESRVQSDENFTRQQKSIEVIVQPVQENLIKLENEIRELEKERTGSYRELKSQVDSLIQLEKEVRQETGNLVQALRQPTGRGQWGEVVLKKVLEMSGMIEPTHFETQVSVDDGVLRPDIIVYLPSGRNLVIDAKAVMSAYLNAMTSSNEAERRKGQQDHVTQLKNQINGLSRKEYWAQIQPSPEFVILFLPAESLFSYALQLDENLIEFAASKKIILATPTTLIALLRTIHYGWKQDEIAKNAKEIGQLGNELYERFSRMIEHFNNVGKSIKKTSETFDKASGSFNSMLRPSFNKLASVMKKEEITEVDQLDLATKMFSELP